MTIGSSAGRFVRIPLISGRLPASQELTIKSGAYMKVGYSPKGKYESAPVAASIVEEALKVLEGRWKMVILFHLFCNGTMRFSELGARDRRRHAEDAHPATPRPGASRRHHPHGLSGGPAKGGIQPDPPW